MKTEDTDDRLSRLTTQWSVLQKAHATAVDGAQLARFELVQRYAGAAYRYLCAACRDSEAALDMAQEFGLRILKGNLGGAHPDRGRFRDYVKAVLLHLVADHFRLQKKSPSPLPEDGDQIEETGSIEHDRAFLQLWRAELLDRTWDSLRDEPSRQPYYQVLRWRVDHPKESSEAAAIELTRQLDRPLTAANYRQLLHRARERFAELLVREVGRSLGTESPDAVQEELAELELLSYCRPVLS